MKITGDDRTREAIVAVYDGGRGPTLRVIARRHKMSADAVVQILTEAGVYKPRHLLSDHPEAIKRCAELVNEGVPVAHAVDRANAQFEIRFSVPSYMAAMARENLLAAPRPRDVPQAEPPRPVKMAVEYDGLIIPKMQIGGISLAAPGLRFEARP